jgi:hypothetical protein
MKVEASSSTSASTCSSLTDMEPHTFTCNFTSVTSTFLSLQYLLSATFQPHTCLIHFLAVSHSNSRLDLPSTFITTTYIRIGDEEPVGSPSDLEWGHKLAGSLFLLVMKTCPACLRAMQFCNVHRFERTIRLWDARGYLSLKLK